MQLTKMPNPPRHISFEEFLVERRATQSSTPGLIVNASELVKVEPRLAHGLAGLHAGTGLYTGTPYFVLKPEQVEDVYQGPLLELLKTVAGHVAKGIHPTAKTVLDGVWLILDGKKFYDELKKPERDKGKIFFGLTSLGLGTLKLVGNINTDYKMPEGLTQSLSGAVKIGKSVYLGEPAPINEMMLSSVNYGDIMAKAFKLAGVALDPKVPDLQAVLIPPKANAPLTQP